MMINSSFAVRRVIQARSFMKIIVACLSVPALLFSYGLVIAAESPASQGNTPMPWAYALNTPDVEIAFEFNVPRTVPGSDVEFVFSNPRNLYQPPDWHPENHPEMPEIVARGREPLVFACGYCHLPNGQGRPENTNLSGLSAQYIIQQMADWRNGLRRSSEPLHGPASAMQAIGVNATEEEVEEAAAYFSSLTPKQWIRLVETDTVPETIVAGWMYVEKEGAGNEPIGNRILEMPEDLERTELRDDNSGFIAYVPVGSIARGEQLVRSSTDGGAPCSACHGAELRGLGPVPALAGRSPSYIARQLFDLQNGRRRGLWSPLMAEVVADLAIEDIVAISAYLASLQP
jgi:cytochrome c553